MLFFYRGCVDLDMNFIGCGEGGEWVILKSDAQGIFSLSD